MSRRRLLLAIVNAFKWLVHSFEYIYHSIIPSTIDGKNVKDNGKMKLASILGNGVIENQLLPPFVNSTMQLNGIVIEKRNNGSFTIKAGTSGSPASSDNFYEMSFIKGHKYLLKGCFVQRYSSNYSFIETLNSSNYLLWDDPVLIDTNTYNADDILILQIFILASTTYIEKTFFPQFIDLTQRYGTGNEPSSIDDPRVQAIINQKDLPFNEGTYKCSSVGLITSEPFNIWDEQWELGSLSTYDGTPWSTNSQFRSKNYIPVIPNATYFLNAEGAFTAFCYYDKNKSFIKTTYATGLQTMPSNCYYVRFARNGSTYNHDICINISGSRNGTYAPHKSYLPSLYQECEYIESSGTQYIDSGVLPNDSTGFMLDFQLTQQPTDNFVYGARYGNDGRFVVGNNGYLYLGFGTDILTFSTHNDYTKRELVYLNYLNDRKAKCGGDVQNITATLPTFASGYNICTFARNSSVGTQIVGYPQKVYKNIITQGTIIIRNFIPCYRKTDGTIGLFDLVEQKFYTNAGTGVFTKGADVNHTQNYIQLPATLDLDGAINSHNEFNEYADRYEFVRNVWKEKLGNYTFERYEASSVYFFCSLTAVNNSNVVGGSTNSANAQCELYGVAPTDYMGNKTFGIGGATKKIFIRDDSITSLSDFENAIANKTFTFTLATPQVISIPKKHLGVVDLGSLNFGRYQFGSIYAFYVSIPTLKYYGKLYCNSILSTTKSTSSLSDLELTVSDNYIYIRDDSCPTVNDFLTKYAGQYLFYETQDEVADFNIKAIFERGGAINTSQFAWIKNQLAGRNDLATQTKNTLTFTATEDKKGYIVNGTADGDGLVAVSYYDVSIPSNHKALVCGCPAGGSDSSYYMGWILNNSPYDYGQGVIRLGDDNSPDRPVIFYYKAGVTFNNVLVKPRVIDLTVGFPNGDVPTSINDPRIQKIIEMGYIPTNTSGTYEEVQNDVLADVKMALQVK